MCPFAVDDVVRHDVLFLHGKPILGEPVDIYQLPDSDVTMVTSCRTPQICNYLNNRIYSMW